MIHRIVQIALRQRFMVLVLVVLADRGAARTPFSACPSTPIPTSRRPRVELITQWPGHAAEEVERLTTLPLELAMNGTPNLQVMRSISLYGLSDVILTFDEGTDGYFARQLAFERLPRRLTPHGRHAQHGAVLQPQRSGLPLRP